MADQLVIAGTDLYDGSYDLDATYFTMGELHTIKRVSGLRRGEIADALTHDDTDLWVALAVIAIQRRMNEQGRVEPVDEDVFWNARNVTIRFQEAEQAAEEDDAGPPATGSPSSANAGSNGSSGGGSGEPSVIPVTVQQGTGTGSWDPSASAPPTSPH